MRGAFRYLLPATFAALTGCLSPDPVFRRDGVVDSPGATKGDREKTLAYWRGVKRIVERTCPTEAGVSALGKQKADDIRALPTDGVDAELVERSQVAALHLDHFSATVAAGTSPPPPGWEASARQMLDANARLAGMRPALASRYKVEFPPLPVVGCPGG